MQGSSSTARSLDTDPTQRLRDIERLLALKGGNRRELTKQAEALRELLEAEQQARANMTAMDAEVAAIVG